jgi:hypothetical protein
MVSYSSGTLIWKEASGKTKVLSSTICYHTRHNLRALVHIFCQLFFPSVPQLDFTFPHSDAFP